jgi:hypothetical protein
MSDVLLINLAAWSAQVALLTAAAALVARLVRVDAPAARYAWWRGVLIVCLLLPAFQSWQPQLVDTVVAPPVEIAAGPLAAGNAAAPAITVRPPSSVRIARGPIVAVLLAAGALVRLAWR